MIETWTCHVCGKRRNDADISVATYPLKDLPGAEINIRYCNDQLKCTKIAHESGRKGNFPHIKKIIIQKKWWQFWM